MKTYPAMNKHIVELLRMTDEPDKLYAAQLIEELQAELKARDERCETCQDWIANDGGLSPDDPAYGYYGDPDKGYCKTFDCDREKDAYCSDHSGEE